MSDVTRTKETIAAIEELAAAGDAVAHLVVYDDNTRDILDIWWRLRGGYGACTVCTPPEPRKGHE